ncbi:methanogenesis marker 9 domain-containing protein [Methanocaldococcus sp.]|uniref:methanogenesis marker 9 domain-containing protein n=1 Tax=Methanocaldococcus sp. TaxID=2152917 RepID=UPI002610432C|nr:methanogenesis marker 9 domain-containing protein [Methanocaldococcus sp.]MCQ6253524.1 methanogenesis marker 9 domain-containing protein [Methanocaldococcus sp.]
MGWENAPSHICRGGDLRGLAFCCPPIKYCPIHKALKILKLSPEEFIRIKEEFGKRTKLGLGKNTCFGSLVWCCKITKPCPYRDYELAKNNITPDEYMELKKELAEEIIKNSPFFKEAVEVFAKKGIPKDVAEKCILETGDLKKAYQLAIKMLDKG